jgi:hypothetical protein
MQNLVRVAKADDLPLKKQTFYKSFHQKKHLEIFVKFGGALFVDLDRLAQAIDKSRPEESVNAATKTRWSRESACIDPKARREG